MTKVKYKALAGVLSVRQRGMAIMIDILGNLTAKGVGFVLICIKMGILGKPMGFLGQKWGET